MPKQRKHSPKRKAAKTSSPQPRALLQKPKANPLVRFKRFIPSRKPYLFHLALGFTLLALIGGFFFFKDVPSPTNLDKDIYPVSTKILDRNGELLYEIYSEENRTPIKLDQIPKYVTQATIAIEDKNFYTHSGFDTGGLLRAGWKTVTGQRLEGGSTITQQLVKVALLTPERTLDRKIKEAVLSLATELLYSKDQILEMYLNHIPYGGTSYGIEAAAHRFFDKDAKDLTLGEAALLAGLPQAPSRYSPFGNPEAAKHRQAQVLNAMVDNKYITSEQAITAKNETLSYATAAIDIRAPHFVMYVRELLESKYGVRELEQGGLVVKTSLDISLQEQAEASLSAEIATLKRLKVSNGAALITNPQTGEVLAMVGSKDYFNTEIDGKVNVTTSMRQPGSSIKPLNYALGLETKVITPSTMLLDTPICFQQIGQPDYCPKNYDNTFRGPTQIRFALGNSLNIPAVKVLSLNNVENFINFGKKMGISAWQDPSHYGLSLTLGGGEVTMTDMVVAFGVFANSGTRVPLQPILEVKNRDGKVIEEYKPETTAQKVESERDTLPSLDSDKVISAGTSFLISHILSDNNARSAAFGPSSVLNVPGKTVSVKTGTTNNLRDNWTIGYTDTRLVAVWVGNNDNTPMSYVASGVTGASPIWQDIMKFTLKDIKTAGPYRPESEIEGASVCSLTGALPDPENPCETRFEYFLKGTVPKSSNIVKRQVIINKDTKHPPAKEEEFGNVEEQEHLMGSDPFTKDYCLDCEPYPEGYEPPAEMAPVDNVPNLIRDDQSQ